MDEHTPVRTDIYDMGAYTIAKSWQERVVSRYARSHSLELSIMRPGFIWGLDHVDIAAMGRHSGRLYLMFGPFARIPLSHVVNCADCLVTALERPAAIGQAFNVIDSDEVRVWRYVREYARRSGQPGIAIAIPYRVGLAVAQLASLVSRSLFGDKGKLPSLLAPRRFESQFKPIRFSNRKLKDVLGWTPPLSFRACLDLSFRRATEVTGDLGIAQGVSSDPSLARPAADR
jgi:UDP-glucose 4-epimerase